MRAKIVVTCLILLETLLIKSGDGATDTLVPPILPNGRQCFCPGDVETYTCTVVGGGVTVWSGTAFDCPGSNNLIALAHALYSGGTATGACRSGAISGGGTSVDTSGAEPCYTSELSVAISANMDGQTVGCSRDTTLIGTDSLQVAGPPPPPTNVMVTEVGVSTFTVTWVEPTSDCGTSFSYDVVSDCGAYCSVSSSMSGVCSSWTAPQSCSVMVRADLCGGQTGNFSTRVMLNLMEPSPPVTGDVSVLAVYSDDSLDSLIVTFPTVSPIEVAPGLSPPVTYSVQTVGDPQVVLMSNCNATLCQYQTEFTSDNRPSNDFTLTVTVSNGIGGGQSVNTPFQVPIAISSLVTLTVVVIDSNANVSANMSSGFQGSTGLTVTYGITPNCNANTVMSASGMAGDTLEVVLTSLQPNSSYCYSIYLTQGELSFRVMGMLRSECDVAELSPDRTIIPSEMCSSDGSAGIMIPNGRVCYNGTIPGAQHFAVPSCMEDTHQSNGSSLYRECLSNGKWSGTVARCEPIIPLPSWVIAVIICAVVLSFATGIIVGILLTLFCGICVQGIRQRKYGTLLLVILLVIVFGLGIGIFVGYCCVKNKKGVHRRSVEDEDPKGRSEKSTGTEMRSPPPVIYEEILDPLAQENLAYSHVQQLQAPLERRGPVYEDIKPDPHTQGNVAYGHVQFH